MEVHAKRQKGRARGGDVGSLGISIFAGEAWTKRTEVTEAGTGSFWSPKAAKPYEVRSQLKSRRGGH